MNSSKYTQQNNVLNKEQLKSIQAPHTHWNIGILPLILVWLSISFGFYLLDDQFISSPVITEILKEVVGISIISMGVAITLLIREIDLSIGYVSGFSSIIMGICLKTFSGNWQIALLIVLCCAGSIGFIHGILITKLNIPSFLVTFLGWIFWIGASNILLDSSTSINNGTYTLSQAHLTPVQGWYFAILYGVVYLFYYMIYVKKQMTSTYQRRATFVFVISIFILSVYLFNKDQGIPILYVIMIFLYGVFGFLLNQTLLGKYIYAIGNNRKLSKKAGIPVDKVRHGIFVLSSVLSGLGGIVISLEYNPVETLIRGQEFMSLAIAGAILGGISVFGGRGNIFTIFWGVLLIVTLHIGFGLLDIYPGIHLLIIGFIILLTILYDILIRKRS